MTAITDERIRDFLLHGTRTGKVAWVAKNGAPHVVPIWFTIDGEDIVFNTDAGSGKGKAFAREGRASFVVDDGEPPFSYVKIDGDITLSDDLDAVRRFATIIGGRYMGADRAEEFGSRNGVDGELLVRLRPTKVVAAFDIAD